MAFRPVNLTELVRNDPPVPIRANSKNFAERALILWNATLGAAQYLTHTHNYYAFKDCMGTIWVQSRCAPHIMPPPSSTALDIIGDRLPYQEWLILMHRKVRREGRCPFDPSIPYRVAVIRLYSEYYRSHPFVETTVSPVEIPPCTPHRAANSGLLKALNPYIAHRSK